ncbi:hypothetical protein PV726_32475 [Streptomyces europaeiscabiei]|uniref:hypothetical protein n=1 Tax=Streptomyces europaeiscabiei TaxID=146819 RepID=UPI0029BAA4A3|nr:hypothetical protein [Streptomyces europaeiscabiei]MDX3694974.1 hypothetical protein [Streptomyces europaeiscabiei]
MPEAITLDGTYELRLEDPNSYVVDTKRQVKGGEVLEVGRSLLAVDAPLHAADWKSFGYRATAYEVKVFDVTGEWPVRVHVRF